MPRKGSQLSERARLKRDFEEQIALNELWKADGGPGPTWHAAVKQRHARINQLSEADLRRRHELRQAMGNPDLRSPEWQAALERLRPLERRKRVQAQPAYTDLHDHRSLYWSLMYLSARMRWNNERRQPPLPVRPRDIAALKRSGLQLTPEGRLKLPGQRGEHHTKEQQAEARRLYRWLWRTFPGLLKACDPELRKLIRDAGGIA